MSMNHDVFSNGDGNGKVLRGMAVASTSTRLAEMAGRLGFDAVWIEMEHGPVDFNQAEALCVASEVGAPLRYSASRTGSAITYFAHWRSEPALSSYR